MMNAILNDMPSIKERAALLAWLLPIKDDAEALVAAESLLAEKHLYISPAALATGETDPDKVFTHLPLFNHQVQVLEAEDSTIAGLPVAAADDAVFIGIHQQHVHVHCGQKHRGIPVEAYRDWLVAHKHDPAALEPVVLLFHNRNIIVNIPALKKGETEPAKLFEVGHADAFIKRDGDGAPIIPLDQLAVAMIYGHHHDHKHLPRDRHQPKGGELSRRAIAALDDFLETVMGIRANHAVVKRRFAKTAKGKT